MCGKNHNEVIYLVWCPASPIPPTKRHESLEEAREEARRLCQVNRGREFFVLRAVESVIYRDDPYVCKNYSKTKIR